MTFGTTYVHISFYFNKGLCRVLRASTVVYKKLMPASRYNSRKHRAR